MNMITKTSSEEQDYELLKVATENYVKAYCHSKNTLNGCAVGQAYRGFHSAINNEIKLSEKLKKVWKRLEQKYAFNHDNVDDIVLIPKAFAQQFQIQQVSK